MSPTEKAEIEGALEGLKTALTGEDVEAIKGKTNDLAQAAMKLGEAMYASQQNAEGQPSGAGGDDVVDAEFEDVDDNKKNQG